MFRFFRSRRFQFASSGLVLLALSGCTPGRYVILDSSAVSLKNYPILEVKDCVSNPQEPNARALARDFPIQVVEKLGEHIRQHSGNPFFSNVTLSTDQTDGVLEMRSLLLNYEEGSQTARALIGLGAGKAFCAIQCLFVDKRTGDQILKVNFEGELSSGVFGGSSKDVAYKVIDQIVDYLKKHY